MHYTSIPLVSIIITAYCFTLALSARDIAYSHPKCENRFEYRTELKELALKGGGCEHVQQYNKLCGQNLTVAIGDFPPYVYRNHVSGKVEGILPTLLQNALDSCCFGCNNVKYIGPFEHMERFFVEEANISMPVFTSTHTNSFFGHDYVHMVEVTAVTFLGPPTIPDPSHMGSVLLKAVWSTWPLFFTAFVMAATAGIAIWILDTKFNESEFPITFPRGPFEGFWWAFVSMTTVGYGDRSPKSTMARLFAVVWILIGITIFSMYTASLSSALTSSALDANEVSIYQKNIGVINVSSVGYIGSIKENTNAVGFETFEELADAMATKKVDGMALDENEAVYFAHELKETNIGKLTLHSRQEISGCSRGMLAFDHSITDLFQTFFEANADQVDVMAKMALKEIADTYNVNAALPAGNTITFFSSNSPLFYITIGSLVGIAIITTVIGLIVKHLSNKYHEIHQDEEDDENKIGRKLLSRQQEHLENIINMLQESERLILRLQEDRDDRVNNTNNGHALKRQMSMH